MTRIQSRDNGLVKEYVRLCGDRRLRRETRRFVIEGARLCADALASGVRVEQAFLTLPAAGRSPELAAALEKAGAAVYEISDSVAQKMADTRNPQGIFCTAVLPSEIFRPEAVDRSGVYAALENLQDPGNLGTVLRTAEALGLDGVLLSEDSADVYSPKAVRAGMGAVFRLPVAWAPDLPELLTRLGGEGMETLAAVPDAQARSIRDVRPAGGAVIVIGNEGAGLTPECIRACRQRVTIPMRGRAESLNAAGASAILMWELIRNR